MNPPSAVPKAWLTSVQPPGSGGDPQASSTMSRSSCSPRRETCRRRSVEQSTGTAKSVFGREFGGRLARGMLDQRCRSRGRAGGRRRHDVDNTGELANAG